MRLDNRSLQIIDAFRNISHIVIIVATYVPNVCLCLTKMSPWLRRDLEIAPVLRWIMAVFLSTIVG